MGFTPGDALPEQTPLRYCPALQLLADVHARHTRLLTGVGAGLTLSRSTQRTHRTEARPMPVSRSVCRGQKTRYEKKQDKKRDQEHRDSNTPWQKQTRNETSQVNGRRQLIRGPPISRKRNLERNEKTEKPRPKQRVLLSVGSGICELYS
jgi:hypothetical protein